jgi:hypothetical protein
MATQENLYPISQPTISPTSPIINSGSEVVDVSGFSISNIVYYLALFALCWSIYYFATNIYQFGYYYLGKKGKEYDKEWRGLQHLVSAYRILWTLIIIQFPLVFFYLGINDFASSLLFGVIFIIGFLFKIFLDWTFIYKLSDWTPDFQYLGFGEQLRVMFHKTIKALTPPTPKPEAKPSNKPFVVKPK